MGTNSVSRLISVVDDDQSTREGLVSLLRAAGFATEAFPSAEEFLRLAGRNGTACLILDVRLPGISGLELQDQLSAANRRIPVIFISGHADEVARDRALKAGAVDFLEKPVRRATLLNAVDSALQQKDQ